MAISHLNHDRSESPQLFLEKTSCPVGAKGSKTVAANKLCTFRAVMSRGATYGPHLDQLDIETGLCHLPGSLGASEASTDHNNGWSCQQVQKR